MLEVVILSNIPGYALFKELSEGIHGRKNEKSFPVVILNIVVKIRLKRLRLWLHDGEVTTGTRALVAGFPSCHKNGAR